MFKKVLTSVAAAVVLTAGAHASTVSIMAPDKVFIGDTFEILIFGDFGADGLDAGGVQLISDAALMTIDNVQLELNVDATLSCPGAPLCPDDSTTPGTNSVIWGNFNGLIPGNAGLTLMATITATATAKSPLGGTPLALVDFTPFTGGWFGTGLSDISTPEFLGTTIDINNVPLPAAVWMMIGGLGALARFRRSK